MSATPLFPNDFVFGAATSALQIEGSPLADGAGPSAWHTFCQEPGRIANGDKAEIACDHYHRFKSDIALMQSLGLEAYRFSIAWGRILPEGRGRINPKGIAYYQRLLEALDQAGIIPFVTLHHWDLPLALMERGGFVHPDSAHWFSDYAETVFRHLGDSVQHWCTFNEPWVMVHMGFMEGSHPPALIAPEKARLATHNILRAHGLGVQAFRATSRGKIGIVVNLEPKYPASDSPEDLEATRRSDAWMNRQFLDPLFLGVYPEELSSIFKSAGSQFPENDMKLISTPMDFLGINYYSRAVVRHAPQNALFGFESVHQAKSEHTAMGWEVFPQGLYDCLKATQNRYGDIPIYLTENGAAFEDSPVTKGRIFDPRRIHYLRTHLASAFKALEAGVPLKGYFAWSLLDNFEWTFGFAKRFGLIHVDYPTLTRTPKDSAYFYREVIETRGGAIGHDSEYPPIPEA